MITLFGSCRINGVNNNNNLNNMINYTHSTKEVIQLINFLTGDSEIPSPYNKLCFRTAICNNIPIVFKDEYKQLFIDTKVFIIEICSNKKYIHNNYYLHHLCVDKRFILHNNNTPKEILKNYIIETQQSEEIEHDIILIQQLLFPRKIIIVSHYNSKINNKYIPSRSELINSLYKICDKLNIQFINPTDVMKDYNQEQVIEKDLGHFTELGLKIFNNYLNNHIIINI